jgi:4-amino-4-deoxy-L-arabinose transferase-like glycosyltransferase
MRVIANSGRVNPPPAVLTLGAIRLPAMWLVIGLCVAVRVGALMAFPGVFGFDQTGAVHGSEAYDVYAQNLNATGVYGRVPGIPDAAIPPGYAYALAAVYALLGRGMWQVGLFHIALDCVAIGCLVGIGAQLLPNGRGRWAGVLAGVMYALYPYLVFQNLTVIDTPLFMAALMGFTFGMVLLRERPSIGLAALTGAALTIGALTRPAIVLFAPAAALWFLFRLPFWTAFRRLLPVVIVSAALVAPWLVHTYQVYGAFVPIATNGGMNFWFGNNPHTIQLVRAGYHPQWISPAEPIRTEDTRLANDDLYRIAADYLRANPSALPELLWVKFWAYWSIDVFPARNPIPGAQPIIDYTGTVRVQLGDGQPLDLSGLPENDPVSAYSAPLFDQIGRAVHRVYFGALLILALIGVALTARAWRDVSLLWFVQSVMTLFYIVYIPATRYRVPTDPLLFLFSAYALILIGAAAWRLIHPEGRP